jgi:uncharacterized protein YkwD
MTGMLDKGQIAAASALLLAGTPAADSASARSRTAVAACPNATIVATDDATRELASKAVLCLINRERAQRHLRPVALSRPLGRSAGAHSADMTARKYFDHVSPGGGTACRRAVRAGYPGKTCRISETLAWGSAEFATPEELVRSLMGSSGHRRIVLGAYRDIGVGLVLEAPVDEDVGDAMTMTLAFGRRG